MPNVLSQQQIDGYRRDGYLSPVRIIPKESAAAARRNMEQIEAGLGGRIVGIHRSKFYLRYRWAYELATTPRMLDIAEGLLGPDILLYYSNCWFKNGGDEGYVTWHQDITYFGHEPHDVLTFWIALTPATENSGCMQVLPGTQREGVLPLATPDLNSKNMLPSGQLVDFDVASVAPVSMPLQPGEASIHNVKTAHGSGPNSTDDRRIGLAFQYIPTHTRQTIIDWDSAALVRGVDEYNHFAHCPVPRSDFDPEAVEFHQHASKAMRDIVYAGAKQGEPTL